jgi:hypothetical protein
MTGLPGAVMKPAPVSPLVVVGKCFGTPSDDNRNSRWQRLRADAQITGIQTPVRVTIWQRCRAPWCVVDGWLLILTRSSKRLSTAAALLHQRNMSMNEGIDVDDDL